MLCCNLLMSLMLSPQTGDESKPWLLIGIGIAVIAVAAFLLFRSRRGDNKEDE